MMGVAIQNGFCLDVTNGDNPLQTREKTMDGLDHESEIAATRRLSERIRRKNKRLRDKANGGFVFYPPKMADSLLSERFARSR
jgi:hypothetical protein